MTDLSKLRNLVSSIKDLTTELEAELAPPPSPTIVPPHHAVQPIGLGIDLETKKTKLDLGGNQATANTQPELDYAIAQAVHGKVDRIILGPKRLRILPNQLSGVTRPVERPLLIDAEGESQLDFGHHTSSAGFSGVIFHNVSFADPIKVTGAIRNVLFESCSGWFDLLGVFENVQFRFCDIKRRFAPRDIETSGLRATNFDGLLVQYCFLHQNGWDGQLGSDADLGGPTEKKHNAHFSHYENLVFDSNVSSDASSRGLLAGCGGIITGNLFVDCPVAIQTAEVTKELLSGNRYRAAITGNVSVCRKRLNSVFCEILGLEDSSISSNTAYCSGGTAMFRISRHAPHGNRIFVDNDNAHYGFREPVLIEGSAHYPVDGISVDNLVEMTSEDNEESFDLSPISEAVVNRRDRGVDPKWLEGVLATLN